MYLDGEPGRRTCTHRPQRRLPGSRSDHFVNTILDHPSRSTCLRKQGYLRVVWAGGLVVRFLRVWADEVVDSRDYGNVDGRFSALGVLLTTARVCVRSDHYIVSRTFWYLGEHDKCSVGLFESRDG